MPRNRVVAYHEARPDALSDILEHGLKRTSRGEKGDDRAIINTDRLLDEKCPKALKAQGVSRDDNVYAYVQAGDAIIDITDGAVVPVREFILRSNQAVLELQLDPSRCFVSDLDTYDALKAAVEAGEMQHQLDTLVASYWNKLVRLSDFTAGAIRRPEIMITYDVPANDISKL